MDGGIITIPNGEIPVLQVTGDLVEALPAAVNFLRCGCPKVQLLIVWNASGTENTDYAKMKAVLDKTKQANEDFTVSDDFPLFMVERIIKK